QAMACGGQPRVGWLYGATGSGKSHLLQASCTRALEAGRAASYLPLSQLREFGPDVLQGWSDAAFVALDELPAVVGQREWEQALFALYQASEERGATLLAAAAVRARGASSCPNSARATSSGIFRVICPRYAACSIPSPPPPCRHSVA